MGNIIKTLHTAIITQGVINRQYIPYAERRGLPSRLEDAIVHVLSRDTRGARVYVHWGVYESGKSRAAKNAAIRLQEVSGKLVMLREGWDFTFKTNLRDWLRISIGIPDTRAEDKLSMFLPEDNRTVMILDHPDYLIKQHGERALVDGLRELEIPVLILVNSWERAVELRKAGCELLGEPGLGRWTEAELNDLYKTFRGEIQAKCSAIKLELMDSAVMSGSPGILDHECCSSTVVKSNMLRAKLMHNEWINGMRALQGQDMGEITGRFPDKNGMFHWD
jgi:hypothetical protein